MRSFSEFQCFVSSSALLGKHSISPWAINRDWFLPYLSHTPSSFYSASDLFLRCSMVVQFQKGSLLTREWTPEASICHLRSITIWGGPTFLDPCPDPQPPLHVPKPSKACDFLNLQHFPSMLPSLHMITALTDVLAAVSWGTLSQSHLAKLLPDSWPTALGSMNVIIFKLLHGGNLLQGSGFPSLACYSYRSVEGHKQPTTVLLRVGKPMRPTAMTEWPSPHLTPWAWCQHPSNQCLRVFNKWVLRGVVVFSSSLEMDGVQMKRDRTCNAHESWGGESRSHRGPCWANACVVSELAFVLLSVRRGPQCG